MSRVKVCDPGEFIASFKPKKIDTAAWSVLAKSSTYVVGEGLGIPSNF